MKSIYNLFVFFQSTPDLPFAGEHETVPDAVRRRVATMSWDEALMLRDSARLLGDVVERTLVERADAESR